MTARMRDLLLPYILALLCLIAYVPWVLGIPGIGGTYATGWFIGFYAINFYITASVVLTVLLFLARWRRLRAGQAILTYAFWACGVIFLIAQLLAWTLILGAG